MSSLYVTPREIAVAAASLPFVLRATFPFLCLFVSSRGERKSYYIYRKNNRLYVSGRIKQQWNDHGHQPCFVLIGEHWLSVYLVSPPNKKHMQECIFYELVDLQYKQHESAIQTLVQDMDLIPRAKTILVDSLDGGVAHQYSSLPAPPDGSQATATTIKMLLIGSQLP